MHSPSMSNAVALPERGTAPPAARSYTRRAPPAEPRTGTPRVTARQDDEDGPACSPTGDAAAPSAGQGEAPRSWSAADDEQALRERAIDHALIRRAQQGEEEAFAELVRRHQQRAWRVARNLVPTEEDAHDLAQEAFLRVFRNLASFDFEHGFTTWLYRIVTNLAIDHLRKRRPAMSTTIHSDDDDGAAFDLTDARAPSPSEGVERGELAQEVHAVLGTLAPHFQSVLVLREIEGLACNEIAKIVGATHVTVRWRLHRGRKLFQEEWERRARWTDQTSGVRSGDPGTDVDELDELDELNERDDLDQKPSRGTRP